MLSDNETKMNNMILSYEKNPEKLQDYWDKMPVGTKKADRAFAVGLGGLLFCVNELLFERFSIEEAHQWGTEKANEFVLSAAQKIGFQGEDLKGAIAFLEKKYPMASDSLISSFGGGLQHHLRDFNHHCSIVGLICSLYTQFSGKVIGTDVDGSLKIETLQNKQYIGQTTQEKLYIGIVEWSLHLISDMAGSSTAIGEGTGIPGPMMSFFKELSTQFSSVKLSDLTVSEIASKLYNGTLLGERDSNGKLVRGGTKPFDLRTELGVISYVTKQSLLFLINDAIIISYCTLKWLYRLCRRQGGFYKNLILNNRCEISKKTIVDMIAISRGVFEAIDIGFALDKAFKESNGETATERFLTGAITFIEKKNWIADINLIPALIADCKINIQYQRDIRIWESNYERELSNCFTPSFKYNYIQLIESLKKHAIELDISITKNKRKRKNKQKWFTEWENKLLEKYAEEKETVFIPKAEIVSRIISLNKDKNSQSILSLILSEAYFFCPYDNGLRDSSKNTGNSVMVEYINELLNVDDDLRMIMFQLSTIQKWVEIILTPEKSPEFRSDYAEKTKTYGKIINIVFSTLIIPNPLYFFIPDEVIDGFFGIASNQIVDYKLNRKKAQEDVFYYTCVKLLVLNQLLPTSELSVITEQISFVEQMLCEWIQECENKKIKKNCESLCAYLKQCYELLSKNCPEDKSD